MGKSSALLSFCEGNPPVIGRFPTQRSVMWRFYVVFDNDASEQTIEQTTEMPVIWDAIALNMTSL